jgi:Transposase IS116/IS110/IS902 family
MSAARVQLASNDIAPPLPMASFTIRRDAAKAGRLASNIVRHGETITWAPIAELPELGSLDRRQIAALVGLAPWTRQSGQWRGKSFIGGGRKSVRSALFVGAMVAARYNPHLKSFRETRRCRKIEARRSRCRRPQANQLGETPRRRATRLTVTPGSRVSATIASFSATVQRRRRSGPVRISAFG